MTLSSARFLVVLAGVLLFAGAGSMAAAGPNAGGTILVTWNPAIPFQNDPQYLDGSLTECSSALVQAPPAVIFPPPDDQKRVWFAYAAFAPGSLPRLRGVSFGIKFPPFHEGSGVSVLWAAIDPVAIDFPSPGWPTQPNSGIVLVFPDARTGLVEELCVFAGYGSAGTRFGLGVHPSIPAQFADDVIPPNLDDIADFGTLGFGIDGRAPCPLPASGACCLSDGSCLVLSLADCAARPGEYQGNGTVCQPNPCEQPVGACCYGEELCIVVQRPDCDALDGWWTGGQSCVPGWCTWVNPRSACCEPDGSCRLVWVEAQCSTGDWRPGLSCDPNPCTNMPGACCEDTGECSLLTALECEALGPGHWWLGTSTMCEPNPCPRPIGACCFPDGRCEELHESDCPTGVWFPHVSCLSDPCTFGACCDVDHEVCVVLSWRDCIADTTRWFVGDGATCDPNPCTPLPPWGACCSYDGSCRWTAQPLCPGGLFYVDQPCDPNPCPPPPRWGACCSPDGSCRFTFEQDCDTGDFRPDVPCTANPCPVLTDWGACCYPDGHCEHVDHIWQCQTGDARVQTPCEPNPCPQPPVLGACCHLVTGLCTVVTEAACGSLQYPHHWDGATTSCDPNPCFDLPGACCLPQGCVVAGLAECEGTWIFGSECSPDVCALAVPGACCYPNGNCYFVPESMCGGTWTSSSTCSPSPCPGTPPEGACCNIETGACVVLPAPQCAEEPYSHLWFEGGCEPNPCPPPPGSGACCRPDGECRIVLQEQCLPPDQWNGGPCQPNPCQPTPVERTSWGRIKSRFR